MIIYLIIIATLLVKSYSSSILGILFVNIQFKVYYTLSDERLCDIRNSNYRRLLRCQKWIGQSRPDSTFDLYSKDRDLTISRQSLASWLILPHWLIELNYASQILLIVAIPFAKVSLTMFISAISPSIKVLRACRILNATIPAWALASIVVLAVQCSVPRPSVFTPGSCVNQVYLMLRLGGFHLT